jgi:hypothetical protein
MKTEMRKVKAALCASRTINKQRHVSCAINQSRASREIKTALRYQSKPRFARNQKRASRNQSRAARVIKGALRAAVSYTSKYFLRAWRVIIFFALRALNQSHWQVTFVEISALAAWVLNVG